MMQDVVKAYKASSEFQYALVANDYFRSDNREVMSKTVLKARSYTVTDASGRTRTKAENENVVGNRIASNFFYRFVTQENQYMLGNGVTLDDDTTKKRLGPGFDTMLQTMGEKALIQGACWGFWNVDHLEIISAAKDAMSGFVALMDERTGAPRIGIEFWQIDVKRPQYIRLFEEDGVTLYRLANEKMEAIEEKRAYRLTVATDAAGQRVTGRENYGALPVVPLWANDERTSTLTQAIKSKIDAYDRILSDYGDNLDRANDVYWVLNNFGGTTDDIAAMLEEINRLKVIANISDGTSSSTAEPVPFEVPYAARQTALDLLRKALYQDAMALDMDELTGGSLTNVAIQAATINLNLKCDRFEWQVFRFVQGILRLIGVETENISFTRQDVVNRSEIVADIAMMRGDIDQRTALEMNPYIMPDRVDEILERAKQEAEAQATSGLLTMEQLEEYLRRNGGNED